MTKPKSAVREEQGELTAEELQAVDAQFRAANYLTVGQIYLRDNPLLTEPLKTEHIKPRLLGHWGTSPGLNLIYAHLNRIIKKTGQPVLYIAGPGHGGPALVANVFLEGTYSELYPEVGQDKDGIKRLFRQFSTPGGVPSHVGPQTPGSIHEGGELGYALVHAFGAAFDNPDLIVACVIGDGEAETAPLEGGWKGVKFLNPERDGAVLPIVHVNGYKIAGPTIFGKDSNEEIARLLEGHGYQAFFVEGEEIDSVHRQMSSTLDKCITAIKRIQNEARSNGFEQRPVWPAIVLRTPKGWTGPAFVDGIKVAGTFRSHQVPLSDLFHHPERVSLLEEWLLSYRPEELFGQDGSIKSAVLELIPAGDLRMGATPYANGGRMLVPLDLPAPSDYAIAVPKPGHELHESTRQLGKLLRDVFTRNAKQANFRLFCPDETNSNRLSNVFEVTERCYVGPISDDDEKVSPHGRVMEVLSEHCQQGWLEGYNLTGRHGIFATYEAFAMIVDSMLCQHSKWLATCNELTWRRSIPSLNYLLTSTCWRNDHNGFSHQGPGFIDVVLNRRSSVSRIYLPPDANCLLWTADHCLRSTDYINLIVIDKQPQLQWLDMDTAREHCARGASVWKWASNDDNDSPHVVLACAGDIVTQETLAAAWLLRKHLPELHVRVVNVVDLMTLFPTETHPHGMDNLSFCDLFTKDEDVIFAFHGYPGAIHELVHGRPNEQRFHVRGYIEEGTTTTPFDMTVVNKVSRYHLAIEAVKRTAWIREQAQPFVEMCEKKLFEHKQYVQHHLEDMPEIKNWRWTDR